METTMQLTKSTNFNFRIILFIVLIIVGGISVTHAVPSNNGADIVYNKSEDHWIQICFLNPDESGNINGIGIRVLKKINGKVEEITAFVNRNITTVNSAFGFAEEDMLPYGWISWIK